MTDSVEPVPWLRVLECRLSPVFWLRMLLVDGKPSGLSMCVGGEAEKSALSSSLVGAVECTISDGGPGKGQGESATAWCGRERSASEKFDGAAGGVWSAV